MASERQLDHRDWLIREWRVKARSVGSDWKGYMELIEELHFIAAFALPAQAEIMVGAIHPMHQNVVRHYLELYGAFDSPA